MHTLVFAIVDEPAEDAVHAIMKEHKDEHWDWYRAGGRWDGYFEGEAEMKARETHNGFNFDDKNESVGRNRIRVKEIGERMPFAFVEGYDWVPREHWDTYAPSKWPGGYGDFIETPDFEKRYRAALAKHPNGWVVALDVHN